MTSKLKVTFEIDFTRLDALTVIMQHLHKLDDLGLLTVKLNYCNASKRDPASLTAYKRDERNALCAKELDNAKRKRDQSRSKPVDW
jgi:hypothetical protein